LPELENTNKDKKMNKVYEATIRAWGTPKRGRRAREVFETVSVAGLEITDDLRQKARKYLDANYKSWMDAKLSVRELTMEDVGDGFTVTTMKMDDPQVEERLYRNST
jgi:hypothetical protein